MTTSGTVSSSRLILDGAVRCTATVTTPVRVGDAFDVSFALHNVSKRTANVQLVYSMWAVIKSPDGTTYNSAVPFEGESIPYIPPTPLKPGARKTVREPLVGVRWEGPLRVSPSCDGATLPPVRVAVTSPGPPASAKAAVDDVVAATGHLLDHCRPVAPGVAVTGQIDAPQQSAPPLHTRCSISLRENAGFDVAQVLVTTTPEPKNVYLDDLYEEFRSPPTRGNEVAVAWQFVVTKNGATPVAAANAESSNPKSKGYALDWNWTRAGPGKQSGSTSCGTYGGGGGVSVEFVSACGR